MTVESTVTRRSVLTGTVTTAAIALAGCTGTDNTPEAVAEAYSEAFISGDYEEVISYSTDDHEEEVSRSDVAELEAQDATIEEIILTDESDNVATADVVLSGETEFGPTTTTNEMTLVTEDGEWLVDNVDRDY